MTTPTARQLKIPGFLPRQCAMLRRNGYVNPEDHNGTIFFWNHDKGMRYIIEAKYALEECRRINAREKQARYRKKLRKVETFEKVNSQWERRRKP